MHGAITTRGARDQLERDKAYHVDLWSPYSRKYLGYGTYVMASLPSKREIIEKCWKLFIEVMSNQVFEFFKSNVVIRLNQYYGLVIYFLYLTQYA